MQEQASLVNYLNQSENQMMLNETFIQSIADIANRNKDDLYQYNFDDPKLEAYFETWVEEENGKISNMLKDALKFYSEQLFEGHLKKLQRMMKIFHCKKKEIFIVKEIKEDDEFNINQPNVDFGGDSMTDKFSVNFPTPGTSGRVDEMLNYMIVTERDSIKLSQDPQINKRLHALKRGESLMRMHMGKGDSNMIVYINATDEEFVKAKKRKRTKIDKISPLAFQSRVLVFFNADELFMLRGVCKSWKLMVTNIWHNIFQREMFHQ